jgi:hypothetical protein
MKDNHLFDVLDPQVMMHGKKEDVLMVATLARSCLGLNGKERPTMKEVALGMEGIQKKSLSNQISRQGFQHCTGD